MPANLAEVGAVYAFRLFDGCWGAVQVCTEATTGRSAQVELATLDYLGRRRPTAADLESAAVLRRDWGSWNGGLARVMASARVPWWAEKIGVLPVRARGTGDCNAWGLWWSAFGAWHRDRWQTRQKAEPSADVAPVIQGVGKHPTMSEVRYEGSDPRFPSYVAQRRVEELRWDARGMTDIDLSASSLIELSLTVAGPLALLLPPTLERLTITGPADQVTVSGGSFDFPFRLAIISPRIVAPPKGMETVQLAEYRNLRDTTSDGLAAYTRLAELILRGGPGRLTDATGLARLTTLRELAVHELYDLDVAHWPSRWPALDALTLHGLRKVDADALKKSPAAIGAVEITAARNDAWLEKNLGNPFREWEDEDPAFGRAAMAAWKKASEAAAKLGSKAKKADAKAVLDALVVALNKVDAKHGIDTLRREEAAAAYFTLARGMGVSEGEAEGWLDERRAW